MDPLECSLTALSKLDSSDIDALMRMNQACLRMLLDPALWAWATAFTVVSIAGGALIGRLKGRMMAGIVWAAVLGPIGWIVIGLSRSRRVACRVRDAEPARCQRVPALRGQPPAVAAAHGAFTAEGRR